MTYEQASEYKKEHENIVGYPCQLKRIPHYIKALFIAPQEIGFEERMKVLNENWYKPIDNEMALKNLGYFNKHQSVYVIWEVEHVPHEMLLHDYLREVREQEKL